MLNGGKYKEYFAIGKGYHMGHTRLALHSNSLYIENNKI